MAKNAADFQPGETVRMKASQHYNHSRTGLNRPLRVVRVTNGGRVIIRLGDGTKIGRWTGELEKA